MRFVLLLILLLLNGFASEPKNCAKLASQILAREVAPSHFERQAGVLMHITSLPGEYGIGEIGPMARRFADRLSEMGQKIWQMLPTGPISFGNSPYQSTSSFANNHLLISIEDLINDGLLRASDVAELKRLPGDKVDFGALIPEKERVLSIAAKRFKEQASQVELSNFAKYRSLNKNWLEDYSLFVALKDHHKGAPWYMWDRALADHNSFALKKFAEFEGDRIEEVQILQYLYQKQWDGLKEYCNKKNIDLVGDIPIFVAHDSSDVWANQKLFKLRDDGSLMYQAGVPPDAFSETGQLWGNPIYDWEIHKSTEFAWWIERVMTTLQRFDKIRIDHFRGFEAYWQVAGDASNAMGGKWVKAPGNDFFETLEAYYKAKQGKGLPIIVEDLGVITDDVVELKNNTGLPGMNIIQFFENPSYRPEHYVSNSVVYTSTHDNQTMMGFLLGIKEGNPGLYRELSRYTGQSSPRAITQGLIEKSIDSKANTAIIPIQDLLYLDDGARMNIPGAGAGNWEWRLQSIDFDSKLIKWLKDITVQSER